MIQVPTSLFQELMCDFSGPHGAYKMTAYGNPASYTNRQRLKYFCLKKLVEATRHIRVMAVQQTVLIFVGQHNG